MEDSGCRNTVLDIDLSSFGILEGISETIVSTGFEFPNAAPIGIIRKSGRPFVRLFKGSHTWANVSKEKYLAANVVYDPLLLVRSTFFDLAISEFEFVPAGGRSFPVLKEASAWVVFKCVNIKNTDQALVAELVPVEAGFNEANMKFLPVPNRGFNAVLEATVHATRYQLSRDEKYLEWILHYEELASKCGGEKEKQAMELLYKVLGL
ncbi:DUF447 family protein [Methanosarcina sp. KYL-1]|uniref:DUF447 domain-containing protein n=1 Tax=Methanosarcina sp. KYL-1 TaxID=2602068 RepID=UPI002101ADDE|nr:DUF447 domain-containing protein [Methanosarcina sp. KYL-1]MCQ1536038.1 DUF447 family protein [Methanosarcina sp. KYL-1]